MSLVLEFTLMFMLLVGVGSAAAVLARRFGLRSIADFYASTGRFGGVLAALTYAATTYSSFMMIGLVGLVYKTGVGALGFELAYLVATIGLLGTVGVAVWRLARRGSWFSPSEVLTGTVGGRTLSILLPVMYLVSLVPYASAQYVGIGRVFEGIGLGYEAGLVFMLLLSIAWTLAAGIWSVAVTDAIQGLWMIMSGFALVAWLSYLLSTNNVSVTVLAADKLRIGPPWTPLVFIGYTVPWVFFAVTNPQVVQRLFLPRSGREYRRMVVLFAAYGLAYTLLVFLVGISAAALTKAGLLPAIRERDAVTPTLLTLAPPLLAAAVYVGIVAASVSTVDSIVLSIASSIAREYRVMSLRAAYLAVALLNAAAALVAYTRPAPIVELSVLSSLLLLPLAPPTIAAALAPDRLRGRGGYVLVATLPGFLATLVAAFTVGAKRVFTYTLLGLPLPLWVLIASTIPTLAAMRK